jgi:hypothetical protein
MFVSGVIVFMRLGLNALHRIKQASPNKMLGRTIKADQKLLALMHCTHGSFYIGAAGTRTPLSGQDVELIVRAIYPWQANLI